MTSFSGLFVGLVLSIPIGIQFFTFVSSSIDRAGLKTDTLSMNQSVKLTRILCLHGYGQNANTFKSKIGGLRRKLKNIVEFSFVDAPHIVKNCEESDQVERAWCLRTDDGSWDPRKMEESLKYIDEYYAKNGPFDGLLAFSQGVDVATILCTLPTYDFKFVIMIAGCKFSVPEYSICYENKIKVPSLHVMGEGDTIVVKNRSEELRDCFCPNSRETIVHEGGHYVAFNKNIRDRYKEFIEKYAVHGLNS